MSDQIHSFVIPANAEIHLLCFRLAQRSFIKRTLPKRACDTALSEMAIVPETDSRVRGNDEVCEARAIAAGETS